MVKQKVGRKERFTTEKLTEIIDLYFANNKVFGQVTATQLAKYADEILGYTGIKYYHFNRNVTIKSLLAEANEYSYLGDKNNRQTYIPFNTDSFFENYKTDPKTTKIILRQFSTRYEELNHKVIELEMKILKYETEIEQYEVNKTLLNKNSKQLSEKNKRLISQNTKLMNYKKFSDKIIMLNYLKEQGLLAKLDEENFRILLENCSLASFDKSSLFLEYDSEIQTVENTTPDNSSVIQLADYNDSENKNAVKDALNILNKNLET